MAFHAEVLALMLDLVDLLRPPKDAVDLVPHHCIILPASFPELVDNLNDSSAIP